MQAFTSFVAAQPNDIPFVFAYKGKYIVQVEKSTVGSPHVNAYYYVDNSQNLVDHDFEAGVPAAGQLTIEKTSHITPGSTAAFTAELRAFFESLGLANIGVTAGRAFNWYDAIAAYYEAPVPPITVPYDPLPLVTWNESAEAGDKFDLMFNYEGSYVLAEVEIVDSENFLYRYNTENGGVQVYNGVEGDGVVTFDGTYTVDSEMDTADLQAALSSTIMTNISKEISDGMEATNLVWSAVQCAIEF